MSSAVTPASLIDTAPNPPRDIRAPFTEAAAWACLAGVVYWLCAWRLGGTTTPQMAYFDELADSFLDGRLWIDRPRSTHDLTEFAGNWYVPFYPLPALLLMPFVAVGGLGSTSTVTFAVVLGALSVGAARILVEGIARHLHPDLEVGAQRWLTAFFGFSTVLWYMSTQGTVWFVSQVCTLLFLTVGVAFAVRGHLLAAAVGVAIAVGSRPHVVLALVGIVVVAQTVRPLPWQSVAVRTVIPIVVAFGAMALYNLGRFDSITETGYATQNVDRYVSRDLREIGQFSPRYIPRNLWSALVAAPRWDRALGRMDADPEGMSIVVTSPAVLLAAVGARRHRTARRVLAGVGLLSIPLVTYYNTGWWQFGYRFFLDLLPLTLVAMTYGLRDRLVWGWKLAIAVGVAMNYWGVAWFNNA